MIKFDGKETLGHIVTKFPGAAVFFLSHQMDYGYHGDDTLEQAANRTDLGFDQLLTALNMLYSDFENFPKTFVDWSAEPTGLLIEHISKRHLPELRNHMNHLEESMADHLKASSELQALLDPIQAHLTPLMHHLEKHLAKEEAVFFALLAYYQETNLIETLRDLHGIIDDLDGDHETLTEQVAALQNAIIEFLDQGIDDEPTMNLITNIKHFTHQITEHIHLENNLLFKQI